MYIKPGDKKSSWIKFELQKKNLCHTNDRWNISLILLRDSKVIYSQNRLIDIRYSTNKHENEVSYFRSSYSATTTHP